MMDTRRLLEVIILLLAAYADNFNQLLVLHALHEAEHEQDRDLYVMPRPDDSWLEHVLFETDIWQAEEYFRSIMRMSRSTFFAVLHKCGQKLIRRDTNWKNAIPPFKVLAIGLYRLAHGTSYIATANSFNVGKTTAIEAFKDVIGALKQLKDEYIKFPETRSEKDKVIAGFNNLSKIKNILGAVDGTHYQIRQPSNNARDYWSRYARYDVAAQAVCDSEYRFLHFACIFPGSMHDARIFGISSMSGMVAEGFREPTHQYGDEAVAPFLLGDSAYGLSASLMKPFSDMSSDPKERHFNKELSRARVKIENAFGIMNGRFRILTHVLNDDIALVGNIILSCAILHNICLCNSDTWDEIEEYDSNGGIPAASTVSGENLRDFLKEHIYDDDDD